MPSQKGSADRVDITFAVSPCDMESVPGLVREINSLNEGLTADKDGQRIALLAQARALVRALETPQETMLQHLWGQVSFVTWTACTPSPLNSTDMELVTGYYTCCFGYRC